MRIYNNYDGYMYIVHNLKIGEVVYDELTYDLDNEEEVQYFLNHMESIGVISSRIKFNTNYFETVFHFNQEYLNVELNLDSKWVQLKATLLNLKQFINNDVIKNHINKH